MPNQKCVKCCIREPFRQVLLQTSLFIIQPNATCLKQLHQLFYKKSAPNGLPAFCEISFKCSINSLLEFSDLTKVIATRLSSNFTFLHQRISEWQYLMIFCYTELLFPRHSESDRTLLPARSTVQSVQQNVFQKYSEKISQEYNRSSPKSKQYFWKKTSVMKFILFSITLKVIYFVCFQ